MGIYVNADDITSHLIEDQSIGFSDYHLEVQDEEFKLQLVNSTFFSDVKNRDEVLESLWIDSNRLYCNKENFYSPVSNFTADYIRNELLGYCPKFTFETVMSHPSKLEFIRKAKELGYKTYLYFVSLEDPELNKDRVRTRVQLHGHGVPEEKIDLVIINDGSSLRYIKVG